jgi:excisionase family DNA binding protein
VTASHEVEATLTVQEAVRWLGVSRSTLYELMRKGRLSYQLVGRSRRIHIQALHRFAEEQRAEPMRHLKHGARHAYEVGCRCDACRTFWNEYQKTARDLRAEELALAADRLSHGTISTYRNHGCRCVACVEAQAVDNRRRLRGGAGR